MPKEHLPGSPKPKLVKEVRRHLSARDIRPTRYELWQLTWEWAANIAHSYYRTHWPSPTEIAAQYLLLLLHELRSDLALRLPYRSATHAPPRVLEILRSPAPAQRLAQRKGRQAESLAISFDQPAD